MTDTTGTLKLDEKTKAELLKYSLELAGGFKCHEEWRAVSNNVGLQKMRDSYHSMLWALDSMIEYYDRIIEAREKKLETLEKVLAVFGVTDEKATWIKNKGVRDTKAAADKLKSGIDCFRKTKDELADTRRMLADTEANDLKNFELFNEYVHNVCGVLTALCSADEKDAAK